MQIGIFGSYNFGNFGDDLMAIAIAQRLKAASIDPVVFRLDDRISRKFSFKSVSSIEELVKQSDKLLVGGGALLNPIPESDTLKTNSELLELAGHLRSAKKIIHLVSVGGSGSSLNLSSGQRALLCPDIVKRSTVRLQSDEANLAELGIMAKYFADLVLAIPRRIVNQTNTGNRSRPVLINLPKYMQVRRLARVLKFIPGMKCVAMQAHWEGAGVNFEWTSDIRTVPNIRYDDPEFFLRDLSRSKCVVSSKLHVGVAALAMGVPFLSVGGEAKTISFIQSFEKYRQVPVPRSFRLLEAVIKRTTGYKPIVFVPSVQWSEVLDEAELHLDFVDTIARML